MPEAARRAALQWWTRLQPIRTAAEVALEFAIGATYEAVRRRSFPELLDRLEHVRAISRFDVNVVINERTLPDLDDVA